MSGQSANPTPVSDDRESVAQHFERFDGSTWKYVKPEQVQNQIDGGSEVRAVYGDGSVKPLSPPIPTNAGASDRKEEQRHVGIGMAIAAGILMRCWGSNTEAKEILGAAGLDTLGKLQACGVDQYDIDALMPLVTEASDV